MSKPLLYAKLKGDEFAEGEICLDLSRKVTCITGEIDLMRLLLQISAATCIYPVTRFNNRLSGITNLSWAIRESGPKQAYGISLLEDVFEFASAVLGRELKLDSASPTFNVYIRNCETIEAVGKLNEDAQYLINWVARIFATLYHESYRGIIKITRENCDKMFIIPYPETFLSPKQQSRLMPALLQLLPNAKFVIATQSPVILTTISSNPKDYYICKMEMLKENRGGELKMNALQHQHGMYGAEMNEAYNTFYDMERAVPEIDQLLKLLQEQTKAKSFDEAGNTVKQLESMIGHSDRELMRLTGILNTRKMLTSK